MSYDAGISYIRNVLEATRTLQKNPDDLDARGIIMLGASLSTSSRIGIGKEEPFAYDIYELEFLPEKLFGSTYRRSLTSIFPRFLAAMGRHHAAEVEKYCRDAFGFGSSIEALVIGLPLGVLLVAGDKDGILPLPGWLMHILNIVINILRSVPFLILMICVFPLTRAIVGTTVGTKATIVPLVVAAFPFVARLGETSLRALFGTAGFGKEDAYFEAILGRVKERLPADCRYLGGFMCPGKMGMGIRRRYEAMLEANPEDSRTKMLLENFDAVLDRPNDQDLEALTNWARSL